MATKDESGKEVVYSFEMGSPNALVRNGFTKETFRPGDQVSFEMHPAFGSQTIGNPLSRNGFTINGKLVKGIAGGEE